MNDKKNQIVKKHNALIQCRAGGMGLRGMRVLALTASRLTVNDDDFKMYNIPVRDISPDSSKNSYAEVKELSEKLQSQRIILEEVDDNKRKKFSSYILFIKCSYVEGQGYLSVQFHPELKKYFLQLQSDFTQFDLITLLRIPSSYSFKLYEILKSQYNKFPYEKRVYYDEEIILIQGKLGIDKDNAPSYLKWKDFSRWVLKPAIKHLKNNTEIQFEYNGYAEYGRKFTHIHFEIWEEKKDIKTTKSSSDKKSGQNIPDIKELFDLVLEEFRKRKDVQAKIKTAYVDHGKEYVIRNIKYANASFKSNYPGLLSKALDGDFGLAWLEKQARQAGQNGPVNPEITKLREKYEGIWQGPGGVTGSVIVDSMGQLTFNGQKITSGALAKWERIVSDRVK